jgi:hypothetical protein
MAGGTLRAVAENGSAFVEPADDDDDAPVLLAASHNRCVFTIRQAAARFTPRLDTMRFRSLAGNSRASA